METPLRTIGNGKLPFVNTGRSETTWALAAYFTRARATNNWRVSFAELVKAYLDGDTNNDLPVRMTRRDNENHDDDNCVADIEFGLTRAERRGLMTIEEVDGTTFVTATDRLIDKIRASLAA